MLYFLCVVYVNLTLPVRRLVMCSSPHLTSVWATCVRFHLPPAICIMQIKWKLALTCLFWRWNRVQPVSNHPWAVVSQVTNNVGFLATLTSGIPWFWHTRITCTYKMFEILNILYKNWIFFHFFFTFIFSYRWIPVHSHHQGKNPIHLFFIYKGQGKWDVLNRDFKNVILFPICP